MICFLYLFLVKAPTISSSLRSPIKYDYDTVVLNNKGFFGLLGSHVDSKVRDILNCVITAM